MYMYVYVQAVSCGESLAITCTHLLSSSSSTLIVCAKLKQSQVFERGGIYGIDEHCKIEAVQWIRTRGHLFTEWALFQCTSNNELNRIHPKRWFRRTVKQEFNIIHSSHEVMPTIRSLACGACEHMHIASQYSAQLLYLHWGRKMLVFLGQRRGFSTAKGYDSFIVLLRLDVEPQPVPTG